MGETHSDPEKIPAVWKVGDVILDKYEVREIFGGGMGTVYRVFSLEWQIELAVKAPRPEIQGDSTLRTLFEQECTTWIKLGLHPNIVTCYFCSYIGNVLRVFSGFVTGGSLLERIRSGRLYKKASSAETIRGILDISIQVARGLDYAHSRGVLHRDVKPGNILVADDCSALVTDFGLSRAQEALHVRTSSPSDPMNSLLFSSGGRTPAYNSPEQALGEAVSRRTDIWSWAVTVLEMLIGRIVWTDGREAPSILMDLRHNKIRSTAVSREDVPSDLFVLLSHCFSLDETERPHDFATVGRELERIYEDSFDTKYSRVLPDQPSMDASSHNNQILSLIELGKLFDSGAENAFSQLLKLRSGHPTFHIGALNEAIIHWRLLSSPICELDRKIDHLMAASQASSLIEWRLALELDKCNFKRAEKCLALMPTSAEITTRATERFRQRSGEIVSSLDQFFNALEPDVTPSVLSILRSRFFPDFEDFDFPFCFADPNTRIIATISEDPRELLVIDYSRNLVVFRMALPKYYSLVAISENAELVAVASAYRTQDADDSCPMYRLAVYSISEERCLGFIEDGHVNGEAKLEALTIDDAGRRISMWWGKGNSVYEGVHDIDRGKLTVYRMDLRYDSHYRYFDRAIVSGDGRSIVFLQQNRLTVWYNSARQRHEDRMLNILDIDLEDFNLVNKRAEGFLPGLEPPFDFPAILTHLRIYNLLHLATKWRASRNTHFIICRPSDLAKLADLDRAQQRKLKMAADADSRGDVELAIRLYSECIALGGVIPEEVLARRHHLVIHRSEAMLARAWHDSTWHDISDPQMFELHLETDGDITAQGYRSLDKRKLPSLHRSGDQIYMQVDSDAIAIGVAHLSNSNFLVYRDALANRADSIWIAAVQTTERGFADLSRELWRLPVAPSRNRESRWPLRKISVLNKHVLVESQPGVVSQVDAVTGEAIVVVREPDKTVAFIKQVAIDNAPYAFISFSPRGYAILDCEGNRMAGLARFLDHPDLLEIADITPDLSAAVGWMNSKRLASLMSDSSIRIIWDFSSEIHEESLITREPYNARISCCGRAIAYLIWSTLQICCARSGKTVFEWEYPAERGTGPIVFDSSSRWLIGVHSNNHIETFQLHWDVPDAPRNPHA